MATLGRNIKFPIYNADGSSFHNLEIRKSTVDSTVMSLADKITGDVYYKDNKLECTMKEYIVYNGVKYMLINPPVIVREGLKADNGELKGMTKYSFEFYHPMANLMNIPFTDKAVSLIEETYKSEDKTFAWVGNLTDYVAKLNKNLEDTEFIVVISDSITSAQRSVISDVMTFSNESIGDALKRGYDTWLYPYVIDSIKPGETYYSNGKRFTISFGLPTNEITRNGNPFVFEFGKGVGLKNNSRTPRNNKIVTRISGYGSENNIPYGYPQIEWTGDVSATETADGYPIYDGIVGGRVVKLIKHPFTRTHLMPSVFSDCVRRKVNSAALDYDKDIELVDYYDADGTYPNPLNDASPKYDIHEFDVKPELGETEIISATPLDENLEETSEWDDTMDDDGNYVQSYFAIKLPVLSFDLYASAAITQEMQINMRGGACLGCTFDVQVDWDEYKKSFYDSDGNFLPDGEQRDLTKFPKSNSGQITVVVRKDINTFGTLMPNRYQYPRRGDAFVILGISLPLSYITRAEERLDDLMKDYMLENNVYYYDYPLKFDEYFLLKNQDILSQIRNNVVLRFKFGNTQLSLYVKQTTVKYGEGVLPQYDITLTDNIEVVLNSIGVVADDVSRLAMAVLQLQNSNRIVFHSTENLQNYVNNTIVKNIAVLQKQIDGQQVTYFGSVEPTLSNYPASEWAADDYEVHDGDMYYDKVSGKPYVFEYNEGDNVYQWTYIEDPDIKAALAAASKAQDTADGKRRVFVTQPQKIDAYDEGDLWVNATYPSGNTTTDESNHKYHNDILKCIKAKRGKEVDKDGNVTYAGDKFSINHWSLASKYTDDSTFNNYINQILNGVTDPETDAEVIAQALHAVKGALNEDTIIDGGLILTSLISLRSGNTTWAGISGQYNASAKGHGIAAWYGGGMKDKEVSAVADAAKSLFRFDGSGYVANGNISWNANGQVTIQGTTIDATTLKVGGSNVATQAMLDNFVSKAFFKRLFTAYDADGKEIEPNDVETAISNIKLMVGAWTEQYLSALGKNDDTSGGGGIADKDDVLAILGEFTSQEVFDNTDFATRTWVNANFPVNKKSTLEKITDGKINDWDATTAWYKSITGGGDTDDVINKWNEIIDFLEDVSDEATLKGLLAAKANSSVKITAGDGLTGGGDLSANRTLSLATSGVSEGTYTKVTVDKYGRVTTGASLTATDIPDLTVSKISDFATAVSTAITGALSSYYSKSDVNAFTWWGQKLSNGVVSGNMTGVGNITINNAAFLKALDSNNTARNIVGLTSGNMLYIGSGTYSPGYLTRIYGWGIQFRYGTTSTSGSVTNGVGLDIAAETGAVSINKTLDVTGLLTANGGITIPTGKTLKIGTIVLQDDNGLLKVWDGAGNVVKGIYATGTVSALGANSDTSGGGGGFDQQGLWEELGSSPWTDKQISKAHLTDALAGYLDGVTVSTVDGATVVTDVKQNGTKVVVTKSKVAFSDYAKKDDLDNYFALYGGTNLTPDSTTTASLDTLTEAGSYYCNSSTRASNVSGKPAGGSGAFRVWVIATLGVGTRYVRQRFQYFNSNEIYERFNTAATTSWSDWKLTGDELSAYIRGIANTANANTLTITKGDGTTSTLTVGYATKAAQDGNGNNIVETYATKASLEGATGEITTLKGYFTNGVAKVAKDIEVIPCRNGVEISGLWSEIKKTSSPYLVHFYDVYDDGGPTTYGNVMEIVGRKSHWQPQLWFDSGRGGHIRTRNVSYNDDTWGDWLTLLDTGNYETYAVTLSTTQQITGDKTFTGKLWGDYVGGRRIWLMHQTGNYGENTIRGAITYAPYTHSQIAEQTNHGLGIYFTASSTVDYSRITLTALSGIYLDGNIVVPAANTLKIGDCTIKYENGMLHFDKGIYSDGAVSALGANGDTSGGGELDEGKMWEYLGGSMNNKVIALSHIPDLATLTFSYGSVQSASGSIYNGHTTRTVVIPKSLSHLTNDIASLTEDEITNATSSSTGKRFITPYLMKTLLDKKTDTKNTAGSTNTSDKIFLIGATSQAANPQTYSHDTAYVGTNGHLYSNSKQVVNLSDSQALTNKTYNGYTLAAACAKGVDTSVTASSTSTNLPTSKAVAELMTSSLTGYLPLSGGTMENTNLVTNLNADLLDGYHAASFTKRVSLNGGADYRRTVIALCQLTDANVSAGTHSNGRITFHRTTGLYQDIYADVAFNAKYAGADTLYCCITSNARNFSTAPVTGSGVRPCRFTYGGIQYGGVEFFYNAARYDHMAFYGETNFDIFRVDYYDTQHEVAVNTEIYNSIDYTTDSATAINTAGDYLDAYRLRIGDTATIAGLLTANGSVYIPTGKYLRIGEAYLTYDTSAKMIKVWDNAGNEVRGIYATGAVSSLGANTDTSGGGTGFDEGDMWEYLGGSMNNKVIALSHIPDLATLTFSYGSVTSASGSTYNGHTAMTVVIPKSLSHLTNDINAATLEELNADSVTEKRFVTPSVLKQWLDGKSFGTVKKIKVGTGSEKTPDANGVVTLDAYPTLKGLMGSTAIGNAKKPIYWTGSAFTTDTKELKALAYKDSLAFSEITGRIAAEQLPTDLSSTYVTLSDVQTITGKKTFSAQQAFSVAQGTSPFTVTSSTLVANLNADLLDGYHATSFTKRVSLNGGTDYRRKVIALCQLTDANVSAGTHSNGRITFHRTNGLIQDRYVDVAFNAKYRGADTLFCCITSNGRNFSTAPVTGTGVRPCRFTYGGKQYGGVEFFYGSAQHEHVAFYGETNFDIFLVDYYDTQNEVAVNTEIYNSIDYTIDSDNAISAVGDYLDAYRLRIGDTATIAGLLTANGSVYIPTGEYLRIGEAYLTYDTSAKMIKVWDNAGNEVRGIYATGAVSSLGANTDTSGGGTGFDEGDMWEWLGGSMTNKKIDDSHLNFTIGDYLKKSITNDTQTATANQEVVVGIEYNGSTGGLTVKKSAVTLSNYLPLSAGSGNALTGSLCFGNNLSIFMKNSAGVNCQVFVLNSSSNSLHLGGSANAAGFDTYVSGKNVYLRYVKTDGTFGTGLSIDQSGLVTVAKDLTVSGTTTLTGAVTASSSVTASSFIKSGGTSSQFLKADGSVDSNTYATTSSLGSYLPLSGGTLTGSLVISSTINSSGKVVGKYLYLANEQEDDDSTYYECDNRIYFSQPKGTGTDYSYLHTIRQHSRKNKTTGVITDNMYLNGGRCAINVSTVAAGTQGWCSFYLGTATKITAANSCAGRLRMYAPQPAGATAVYYNTLVNTQLTANRTHTLPNITGTFIMDAGAQTITGVKTFSNGLTAAGVNTGFIEMKPTGRTGDGGYIDFHYNNSDADFTSRIIEDSSSHLHIYADSGVYVSGYITSANEVTASSDERLKNIAGDIRLSVKDIASAPSVYFYWKDGRDKKKHIGSIAQYWEKVLPESVSYDGQGYMSLNYQSAALVAAIAIARAVSEHESRLTKLERENKALKKRIAKLETELEERRA